MVHSNEMVNNKHQGAVFLLGGLYRWYFKLSDVIIVSRLPATIATYALLGSYVAQSDMGDFSDENADAAASAYNEALSNARLTPVPNAQFFDKVKELHKAHKLVLFSI